MDNQPAFPEAGLSGLPNGEFIHGRSGMTILEYYAAEAMKKFILTIPYNGHGDIDRAGIARASFDMAEAIIAEYNRRVKHEL